MKYAERISLIPLLLLAAFVLSVAGQQKGERLLDMTYPVEGKTIYWPTAKPFVLNNVSRGISEGGWRYASNEFSASEHGGTHANAPIHFAENGRTIDQIPLEEWIGPEVKVDVVRKCSLNRDYLLSVEDLENWESNYGQIPDSGWVIMYSAIDTQHYPDKKKVLGTEKTGEAVDFLLKQRNIKGLAIDTPSIDCGKSKDFKVHQLLFAADKLALENIANLDELPAVGATLYVNPMLIKDGTGAPARVFARFSEKRRHLSFSQSKPKSVELENLTWVEADRALKEYDVVLFALGARTKEHGPHLPLKTDYVMAEYLKDRVAEQVQAAILPTLQYGYYPSFLEYPGSVSLQAETFKNMILDICRSINGYGVRKYYVLNTGISTLKPLEEAAKELKTGGIVLRYLNLMDVDKTLPEGLLQQEGGTHADEAETSMMLYFAPEAVDMSKAVKDYDARPGRKGLTRNPQGTGTYSPTGIWGDPTLATPGKGRVIVEATVRAIVKQVRDLIALKLD